MDYPIYDAGSMLLGRQQTALQNQLLQENIQNAQYKRESDMAASEAETTRQAAIANALTQPAPPLVQQAAQQQQQVDPVDQQINSLTQTAQSLYQAADKVRSLDPKLSIDFTSQATRMEENVTAQRREQLAQQKDVTDHLASVLTPIKDQASLDNARAIMNARHPGLWEGSGLPTTYDATTGKQFQQWGLSASTASQQADIAIKAIESKTASRYYEARTQKAEADVLEARRKAITTQENLPKGKAGSGATAYEKYQTELEKEQNKYTTDLSKARQRILLNPKAYPPKAPDYTQLERAKAAFTGETLPPKQSPRDKALAMVEAEHKAAHDSRVAAIQQKAAALGVAPAGKTAEPKAATVQQAPNYADVMGKLKAANPNVSDSELEAYAKSKGYLK